MSQARKTRQAVRVAYSDVDAPACQSDLQTDSDVSGQESPIGHVPVQEA